MAGPNKSTWDNSFKKIRDIVFIIMFLATLIGWGTTTIVGKSNLKFTVEQNTKAIQELKDYFKEYDTKLSKQNELNGKIIQYMVMDSE